MSMPLPTRRALLALFAGAAALPLGSAHAQSKKAYAPGVTDTEIVIGQTMPYSGPASSLAVVGKVQEAYFQMVNDRGGINGRKIKLISLDDGYSPPRALEQTRRLVEQENVALIFGVVGTPTNAVIQKYLNAKKVPQLFIMSAAARFYDPKASPWTMSSSASMRLEGVLHARYLLKEKPGARIAVIYQNDDYGKDYMAGLNEGLGESAARMVIATASYEPTDPTVDSQIVSLKTSGADVLMVYCAPKAAAQAIRKTGEIGWKPLQMLSNGSRSVSGVLVPAGPDNAIGLLSLSRTRDLEDPEVAKQPDVQAYFEFMKKYVPSGHATETPEAIGYLSAFLMAQVLQRAGDELTRENIMKQATSMKEVQAPFLLPGATVSTTASDYEITKRMIFTRFDGKRWLPVGQPLGL